MYSYIFDIGGVLVQYDSSKIIKRLAQKTNCDSREIERLFQLDMLYDIETGRITREEFYEKRICRFLPGISFEDWMQTYVDHFEINPPAMKLLLYLKQKGNKVYILSNLAEFHKQAIESKIPGFFNLCDKNFLSYELGFHKPEQEIFKTVVRDIGEKAENCVFFDDIPKNIEGANKAGMIGILYSDEHVSDIYERIKALEEMEQDDFGK